MDLKQQRSVPRGRSAMSVVFEALRKSVYSMDLCLRARLHDAQTFLCQKRISKRRCARKVDCLPIRDNAFLWDAWRGYDLSSGGSSMRGCQINELCSPSHSTDYYCQKIRRLRTPRHKSKKDSLLKMLWNHVSRNPWLAKHARTFVSW